MPDPNERNKLDEVEKGIDDVVEKMGLGDKVADLSDDIVNQMKNSIMPWEPRFRFPLGSKVKNRHNETGYIEMCGIDFRGELYLVNFKDNNQRWLTSSEMKIIEDPCFRISSEDDEDDPELPPSIKTDIPDPKEHIEHLSE